MARDDSVIPTPPEQRWVDFRQRRLPVVVWVSAVLICAWMLTDRTRGFEYLGLAQALHYEVSTTTTGRLASVNVELYDRVEAGDVLARIEDEEIAARLARSRATIRQLTAQLAATRTELAATSELERTGWVSDLRRFQADEEERRLAALELRVQIEGDEIQLERLALDLQRARPLLDSGLIGDNEYDETRLLHDEVARRLEENRNLLIQTEREYDTARSRRDRFERGLPTPPAAEPLLRPVEEAISVETERLREIQARRDATVLRSPVSGLISRVLGRRGQTVTPGDPILVVTDPAVGEILAFIGEGDRRPVLRSDRVLVASAARPDVVAESVVLRVAPGLDLMPERLWRSPAVPEYGRAVVIASTPGLGITPGELMTVRFTARD